MRNKAKKLKKLTKKDLMAHQIHDSTLGTSLHGKYKQHYQCNILPVQVSRSVVIHFRLFVLQKIEKNYSINLKI